MPQFFNGSNQIIRLGAEIGRGGEGSVYEIAGDAVSVAKIYHEVVSEDKAEKLRQMVRLKSEKLLKLAAWTTDVLQDENGRTVGFVMPRINAGKAIHELYTPKSRRRLFPEADWRFLCRAAANLARAFSVVHSHNHAVGDVNHGNVVIARDATVRLIDCDSYHLNAPGKQFLCEVGVSTHTPPELQNRSLRAVERIANHDNFGLAVLIFQLLFMGRHPFSGAFLGAGENTLENSIAARRFAYGDGAREREMRQPPGTLPLATVSAAVADLFERAFLEIENRPTAKEWIAALDELERNLQQCGVNSGHYFWRELARCPWCKLEGETGVLFFPAHWTGEFYQNGEFDLLTLGRLIDAIKPPDLPDNLPAAATPSGLQNTAIAAANLQPISLKTIDALNGYQERLIAFLVCLGATIFLTTIFSGFSFFWIVPGYWICSAILKSLTGKATEKVQLELDDARQNWQNFTDQRSRKVLLKPFQDARSKLKLAVEEYRELPRLQESRLINLEQEYRRRQFDVYLNKFSIRKAEIADMDEVRLELLKSNGIKTAADVTPQTFAKIPYFSHAHKQKLYRWRADLEKKFVAKPLGQFEKERQAEILEETMAARLRLETILKEGLPRLQQVAVQVKRNWNDAETRANALAAAVAQAENDFQAVTNLHRNAVVWTVGVAVVSFGAGILLHPAAPQPKSARVETNYPKILTGERNNGIVLSEKLAPKIAGRTAAELVENAEKYFAAGEYENAAAAFEKAASLNPGNSKTLERLGETLHVLDRYAEAINAYRKVVKLNANNAESWRMLGLLYEKTNRLELAAESFKSAAKIKLKDAAANYEAGAAYRKIRKHDEAINFLLKATELNEDLLEAHFELGLCYLAIGDAASARKEKSVLENIGALWEAEKLEQEIVKKENLSTIKN